jgi:hypothetical protein
MALTGGLYDMVLGRRAGRVPEYEITDMRGRSKKFDVKFKTVKGKNAFLRQGLRLLNKSILSSVERGGEIGNTGLY